MWDRKKLKEIAKEKFQANYWKCVLVALLFAFITGGVYNGSGITFRDGFMDGFKEGWTTYDSGENDEDELFDDDDTTVKAAYNSELGREIDNALNEIETENADTDEFIESLRNMSSTDKVVLVVILVILFTIIFLIIAVISILVDAFLLNPLEIGCAKFFYKNLSEPANVSNVACGFDHGYKNGVKIMLWRDFYHFLWSLLFIIPGIVKAYEYKMIPYLLAENPEMTKQEAFAESKRMMDGQKWRAFVLDLSFIGWDFLSIFTFGLLPIFFVTPYKRSAQAALYDALKYEKRVVSQSDVAPM